MRRRGVGGADGGNGLELPVARDPVVAALERTPPVIHHGLTLLPRPEFPQCCDCAGSAESLQTRVTSLVFRYRTRLRMEEEQVDPSDIEFKPAVQGGRSFRPGITAAPTLLPTAAPAW